MESVSPTNFPDVNKILDMLLNKVTKILKDQFVGMYLFGSLANGGFDPHSDIDSLVVTKDEITTETFSALYSMHECISGLDSPWAIQLEVSYIPKDALRRHDPSKNKHPHIDRGNGEKLHIMKHDSDWIIQRFILRERGRTVVGPDPKSLIDPVSPKDLKLAVLDILNSWIKGFLEDPQILESRGYQSYTVLTLCRILHTHKFGTIATKPVAANWARQTLDRKWIPLIDRAWEGRGNPGVKSNQQDINDTLEFIRYSLDMTS
jgi:predicted nucleotidyltransferase